MLNLFIFNHINENETIKALLKYKRTHAEADYCEAARGIIEFAPKRLTNKNILGEFVLRLMLESEHLPDISRLRDFLRHDVKVIFSEFINYDWEDMFRSDAMPSLSGIATEPIDAGLCSYSRSIEAMLDCGSNEALGGAILAHAESFGTGSSSAYSALKWEKGRLKGITHPDSITFDMLTGLEHQKKVLIANTESFVNGKPANDVLLTGSSGTGKSSSAKACLNMFKDRGLRLIELDKADLIDLSALFGCIKNDVLKYIVFIDDLSFEPGDMSYKILKSALDGQAEARGNNILIYATSNRRGLIKETWSEREGYSSDEVHRSEGIQERKSLSARFGINLSFLTPTQNEYLSIVEDMLHLRGMDMTDEIRAEALKWQINYNGFSGRTAKQFILNLLGSCE